MNAYPVLTRSQELILLGQQLMPASPLNNMGFLFTLGVRVDGERMRAAFSQLIAACDAMRSTIQDGQLITATSFDFELPIHDFSAAGAADAMRTFVDAEMRKPFNLEEQLFAAALFKLADDQYALYLNQHHLITDGWGYAVQLEYLLRTYAGEEPGPLASFRAYVARRAVDRTAEKYKTHVQQWQDEVAAYPDPPVLFGRENGERRADTVRIVRQLSLAETTRLRAVCSAPDVRAWTEDLALFNILLTTVFTYVCRVSGQYDLAVGAPAHNRLTPSDKQTPGLFMELFPLRATLSKQDTLGDVLNKVKVSTMAFLKNARTGTSSSATGRSFNVLLNFINQSFHREPENLRTEWLHPGQTEPGHHFKVQVYDFDATGRWTFCFDLNTAVVTPDMQSSVVDGFFATLWQVVDDRSTPLHTLGKQEQQLLAAAEWQPADDYPDESTVLDLIERQVQRTPGAVAVRYLNQQLSFSELNGRADKVAAGLFAGGVRRGDIIPICLERSLAMMVGLVGIMKAGAAYLPIDPALPNDRIAFLGKDAAAKMMVTEEGEAARLASCLNVPQVVIEETGAVSGTTDASPSSPSADQRPRPEDLIYVLYTSGSTGKPKGVMNQHDGLVNRLEWARRTFVPTTEKTIVLQKTTFTFDVSAWELLLPLICGAELVLAKKGGEKDATYLRQAIRDFGVTMLHFVPPMLELFLLEKADLPSLRTVICSGEALLPHQANTFNTYYPHVKLHNLYGPTEAAIDVTHWAVPPTPVTSVPIGAAIDNVRLRVYGSDGQVCPLGVPGELFLGGVQVARGYLHRPELTADKFVERDNQRWYRTGDLVRWQPDGNLVFLGRIDHQVKLRGFRIELGEIEACLRQADKVEQAVVVLGEDGKNEPALIAYVVAKHFLAPAEIRQTLATKLPAYMVPSTFVLLEEMPLLRNGKIDRKGLPKPDHDLSAQAQGETPRGEFEEIVHEVWTEVFQLESIGRKVHFLDLGGHSLTGIRLIGRVNDSFELELPANTIFRYPTIARLAEHVEATIRKLLAEMDEDV